jgi:pimeloyl-ACP methyl ester carboxylesterase
VAALQAQETPSVFIHGGASTGETWAATSDSLRNQFLITVQRPTVGRTFVLGTTTGLGGWADLSTMSSELRGTLTVSGTYAAVGHSAGGLVARQLVYETRQSGSQQRIDRLVTVGTPHGGLPLVQRVLGGGDVRRLDESYSILYEMIPWYTLRGIDIFPFYQGWQQSVSQVLRAARGDYRSVQFWIPMLAPITADLHPQSERLLMLNAGITATESFMNRAVIVGQTTNQALLFKATFPILPFLSNKTPAELRAHSAQVEGYRRALAKAFYGVALAISVRNTLRYAQSGLPPCITGPINSYTIDSCLDEVKPLLYFLAAAYAVDQIHPLWRRAIGAGGDNTSDGLVPESSQLYPGLPSSRRLNISDGWHGLQTRETRAQVATVMSQFWNIAERIQPLTNDITKSGFNYTANPSGGRVPYSYLWEWFATPCAGDPDPLAGQPIGGGPADRSRRPPPRDSITTQALPCGWQYYSTQRTIYFTYSQRTLRSTVTDADSRVAVATYSIP